MKRRSFLQTSLTALGSATADADTEHTPTELYELRV